MDQIDSYTGLDPLKKEVRSLYARALNSQRRAGLGLPVGDSTMHLIFSGPPGTGKTTMAREVGQLYYSLGLIDHDPTTDEGWKELSVPDLIAEFRGQTPQRVKDIFEGNEEKGIKPGIGGVIFIDEAYGLVSGKDDEYGKQAVAELLRQAENHRDNTVVIMAGYGDQMDELFQANPGLKRRFPTTLNFTSYDAGERYDIMRRFMADEGYTAGRGRAAEDVRTAMRSAIMETGGGNAGDVRNLWDQVKNAQATRLAGLDLESMPEARQERILRAVTPVDVKRGMAAFASGARVDEPLKGTLVPTGVRKPRKRQAA